jgi:hypothetical protein
MNHAAVWTEYRAEDEVRAIYGAAQALGAYADFRESRRILNVACRYVDTSSERR